MTLGSKSRVLRRPAAVCAVGAVLAFAWGCDTAPGPERPGLESPVVTGLSYEPGAVVVEDLPAGAVVDGIATVAVQARVRASDPDGDLDRVEYVVRGPSVESEPVATGRLEALGGGQYGFESDIGFPVALPGRYTLLVFATDQSGRLGNDVRGAIDLVARGTPPQITDIEMPTTVQRPAAGQDPVPVVIVATATDPDGLANILRVETVVNSAVSLNLCDDGGVGSCNVDAPRSGDLVAGDGRFTLTIVLESKNSIGPNTFVFTAIDRSGQHSAPITRTLEVIE